MYLNLPFMNGFFFVLFKTCSLITNSIILTVLTIFHALTVHKFIQVIKISPERGKTENIIKTPNNLSFIFCKHYLILSTKILESRRYFYNASVCTFFLCFPYHQPVFLFINNIKIHGFSRLLTESSVNFKNLVGIFGLHFKILHNL